MLAASASSECSASRGLKKRQHHTDGAQVNKRARYFCARGCCIYPGCVASDAEPHRCATCKLAAHSVCAATHDGVEGQCPVCANAPKATKAVEGPLRARWVSTFRDRDAAAAAAAASDAVTHNLIDLEDEASEASVAEKATASGASTVVASSAALTSTASTLAAATAAPPTAPASTPAAAAAAPGMGAAAAPATTPVSTSTASTPAAATAPPGSGATGAPATSPSTAALTSVASVSATG